MPRTLQIHQLGRGPLAYYVPPAGVSSGFPFPTTVSGDARYVVDQHGQPWHAHISAQWFLVTRSTTSDLNALFTILAAQGYNAVITMAMVSADYHNWNADGFNNDPATLSSNPLAASQNPMLDMTLPSFAVSNMNETYWQYLDTVVDTAATYGITVILAYAYWGYAGEQQGWWTAIGTSPNTPTVGYNFGQWLATTRGYKNKPNVIWFNGGDNRNADGANLSVQFSAQCRQGMIDAGDRHLAICEWHLPDDDGVSQPGFTYGPDGTYMQSINTPYGYGPAGNGQTYVTANTAWTSSPTLPVWLGETSYYGDHFAADTRPDREWQRNYLWWQCFAGGTAGISGGIETVWHDPSVVGRAILTAPVGVDRQIMHQFFIDLTTRANLWPWHLLRPSGTGATFAGRVLVPTGAGSGDTQIVSALTSDNKWLVAFTPTDDTTSARTFAVDLRSMNGNSRARWYNTTTAVFTDITGGAYSLANTLSAQSFTTPGANGDTTNGTGNNDWVLAIDSQ